MVNHKSSACSTAAAKISHHFSCSTQDFKTHFLRMGVTLACMTAHDYCWRSGMPLPFTLNFVSSSLAFLSHNFLLWGAGVVAKWSWCSLLTDPKDAGLIYASRISVEMKCWRPLYFPALGHVKEHQAVEIICSPVQYGVPRDQSCFRMLNPHKSKPFLLWPPVCSHTQF